LEKLSNNPRKSISIYQQITLAIIVLGIVMSGANIEIVSKSYENDTFTGSTLVQRDTYAIKGQVYAVKTDYYYELISQYDDWNSTIMYRIMECESKGNPEAHNFSHRTKDDSWGLFQINRYGKLSYRPSAEWLKVPENNVEYAYEIFKKQSYGAWKSCYQSVTK